MDDFLHNLRSGKLKQPDRSNRSYSDPQYKGGQRRNAMDRRKKELDAFERLNAVKEVLESISETQKRMAEAYESRTRAEERKAHAMEVLAKNLYRMLNPEAKDVDELFAPPPPAEISPPPKQETAPSAVEPAIEQAAAEQDAEEPKTATAEQDTEEPKTATAEQDAEEPKTATAEQDAEEPKTATAEQDAEDPKQEVSAFQKLTEEDRQRLFVIIDRRRIAGDSWEKIARHIASQGYPTVSGKGNWRGIMAKNLYEKMLNE